MGPLLKFSVSYLHGSIALCAGRPGRAPIYLSSFVTSRRTLRAARFLFVRHALRLSSSSALGNVVFPFLFRSNVKGRMSFNPRINAVKKTSKRFVKIFHLILEEAGLDSLRLEVHFGCNFE